ncbi:hypothetical protein TrCOL_g8423 [Triparma columacea]|uniref:Calmodulin n=1 Tax=Triparma columacea TaxID=722753 RepID=A0A9W7GKF0_9STRA|nr:hypothetical protein TrCOL_g8423 [Triparma columacea]
MRPKGDPPPKSLEDDLKAARGMSQPKKPNLKRPPAPPPKRDFDDEEEVPLSKRKPPPSTAPPESAARDLSNMKQGPRPPKPTGEPPKIPPSKIEQLSVTAGGPGKAPPQAKEGGRSPSKLPPPGAPPPGKNDGAPAHVESKMTSLSPEKRGGIQRRRPPPGSMPQMGIHTPQSSGGPSAPSTPVGDGYVGGAPPRRPGVGSGAPPLPSKLVSPPYRAPPGAPPGKSPPREPPSVTEARTSATVAAGLDTQNQSFPPPRRPPPSSSPPPLDAEYPKGRKPPPGLPPGRKPRAPRGEPKKKEELKIKSGDEDAFPELALLENIPAPDGAPPAEAPPPPDEPPPPLEEDGEIGAPRGAPPKLGADSMPKPPEEMTEEERQIAEKLKRGRLSVKCIQASNVRRKDQATTAAKIDAYLCVQLGDFKKAPRLKTGVRKRSGQNPQFNNEVLSFDMVDPGSFVRENDIKLKIELWDNNAWNDDILGEVTVSAVRFLSALEPQEEWLPLVYPGDESSNSKVQVEFRFEEAKVGMAVFTLYEGKNLGTSEMKLGGDMLSPYVSISMGDNYHKRSQTQVNGGQDPYFAEEQILMWVDEENWTKPATLTTWHEDVGDHDVVGKHELSLLPYMVIDPDDAKQEVIPMQITKETTHEGVKKLETGEIMMKCEFLVAGSLKIHVKSGRNLRETESIGRLDPYIVFKADGYAVKINKRTSVDKDGGSNPDWDQKIGMELVDQYQLQIECYDHDVLASTDELVGKANISLLPVFKKGHVDTWITLKHKNQFNVLKDAGEIHVIFDFTGDHGVAYPQHQPAVDSYDDTHRIDFEKVKKAEEKRAEEAKMGVVSTGETAAVSQEVVLAQDVLNHTDKPKVSYECGFNDEEIRAAFDFIDLDNNDYVGAAEIRHVLICMGELVTDEEVDMMISMVDTDGDGQVGYGEFYMMVTDEDPARPDFGKSDDTAANRPEDAAKSFERQREMAARDLKRRMLTQFVSENQIGPTEVGFAWEKYTHQPPERIEGGVIDFELFCELLQVEPTGEYHKLFGLFDGDGSGDVDIKEFILGLCNFVDMDNDKKCRFIFELFDDDHSGFLAMSELEEILMANHMQSRKACQRKAQTIMRAADIDGSGAISLAEFIVCSAKFPNILFPNQRE